MKRGSTRLPDQAAHKRRLAIMAAAVRCKAGPVVMETKHVAGAFPNKRYNTTGRCHLVGRPADLQIVLDAITCRKDRRVGQSHIVVSNNMRKRAIKLGVRLVTSTEMDALLSALPTG